jgi:hypothetical protein
MGQACLTYTCSNSLLESGQGFENRQPGLLNYGVIKHLNILSQETEKSTRDGIFKTIVNVTQVVSC